MTAGALGRAIREAGARRAEQAERCGLCREPLGSGHRHLLDTGGGELLCACRPCSVLFVGDAASEGHFRLVPQRRIRLAAFATGALGIPVGLAFVTARADGSAVAHFPSPAGATRCAVGPQAWQEAVRQCPQLATLAADVEALLVNTAHGQQQHWIVPVDDCFRMVAVVRREWRGLSGGSRVWPEIERFFAELAEQAGRAEPAERR